MVTVSQVFTYLHTHQDVYIKYVELFCMSIRPQFKKRNNRVYKINTVFLFFISASKKVEESFDASNTFYYLNPVTKYLSVLIYATLG